MRDFSGQNLRGRNFRGQDLRGASFVNADIRGANFTDAELQGADFTGAIAGLQKRWAIGQAIVGFGLSLVMNFIAVILNAVATNYFFQESQIKEISIVPGIVVVLIMLGVLFILAKEGFKPQSLSTIIILLISAFAFAVTFAVAFAVTFAGTVAAAAAFVGAAAGAFVGASVFAGAFSFAVTGIVAG
jgi:Pentapeptide repeats (8 copies)